MISDAYEQKKTNLCVQNISKSIPCNWDGQAVHPALCDVLVTWQGRAPSEMSRKSARDCPKKMAIHHHQPSAFSLRLL